MVVVAYRLPKLKTDPVKNEKPLNRIDGSAVTNITTAMTTRIPVGTTAATPLTARSSRSPRVISVSRARPASTLPARALIIDTEGVLSLARDGGDLRLDRGEHRGGNRGLEADEVLLAKECRRRPATGIDGPLEE